MRPTYARVTAFSLISGLALTGCGNGSSSSDPADTENGGAPEVAAAKDIYDGDYDGPTDPIPLDDAEDGAAAMDLTYLVSRAHTLLNSVEERVGQNLNGSTGPETVSGDCPGGGEDGEVSFEEESDPQTPPNNGTVVITSTYKDFDDYCIEKFDTGGPVVIRGSSEPYIVEETATFVDGQAEKVEVETTVEKLVFEMRGSEFEMSGTEVIVAENEQNAGALAFDLAFEGDSAEENTVLRFLADVENDMTPEGNIREIDIASNVLGGSVQSLQQGTTNFFDDFSCGEGLSGPLYVEAQQGRVTLIDANDKELVADLSENGNCEQFVLSGGPQDTFTLLDTLFEGL